MVNHHRSPVVLFEKRVCKCSVDGFNWCNDYSHIK